MTCPPCNHNCRQGRECTARTGLHTDDGGHLFNGGVVFPHESDAPIVTPEEAGTWSVVAQVLFIAIVVSSLCFAFIQIVLPTFYH
jgi:hypothetical protein